MWTSGVSQTGNVGGTTSEGATPATQEYYVGSTRYMWTRIKPLVASLKITGTISGSNVSINYAAGFSITADSDTYKLLDVATLTANGGTASYTWAYSTDGGSTYTTIKLSTSCSSGTLIFSEDFGSYGASDSYSADKRRNSCADVPSSYIYVSECYTMKNGGDYAIVTNPVWGGCGDQGISAWGCDCTDSYWYRSTYDHTQGGYDSSSKLGGMLMLNCKDGSQSNPDVLYQKTVTIPCPNTLLFHRDAHILDAVKVFVEDEHGLDVRVGSAGLFFRKAYAVQNEFVGIVGGFHHDGDFRTVERWLFYY